MAAAGGVCPNARSPGVCFARRITPPEAGRTHPLLTGQPAAYNAPAIHNDEVEVLPPGTRLLAGNCGTTVQAVEIWLDGEVLLGRPVRAGVGLDEPIADKRLGRAKMRNLAKALTQLWP